MPEENEQEQTTHSTEQDSQNESIPAQPTEWRMGDNAPSFLRGKSEQEVVQTFNQIVEGLQQMQQAQNIAQQQQVSVQAQQAASQLDPDLMYSDPDAYQRQLQQAISANIMNQVNAASQPLLASTASLARSQVATEMKDVFDKWGHEVDQKVARIPLQNRTPELYREAAKMVRGDHLEEIVQDRAQKLAASNPGLASSGNFESAPANTAEQDIWAKFESNALGKQQLAVGGKPAIRQAAKAMNMTLREYAEMVETQGKRTTFNPLKPGEWSTRLTD